MGARRKARELALQLLYSLEFNESFLEYTDTGHLEANLLEYINLKEVIDEKLIEIMSNYDSSSNDSIKDYLKIILHKITDNLSELDNIINQFLKNGNSKDLSIIDRNLLRIALTELLYLETPKPVVIDETVEIAKKFSKDKSNSFIHGLLDQIIKGIMTEND